MAEPSTKSGRFSLAPGVRIVPVQAQDGSNRYYLVDDKRGVRHALSELEHQVVTMLRSGLSQEDVKRRIPQPGVAALCERLLGANLLTPVLQRERPSFLPDDRPKLGAGVWFVQSDKPGIVNVIEPRCGRSYPLRDVDAEVARALDGKRSVIDICEAARRLGIPATVPTMGSFLRELWAMGCIEGAPAPGPLLQAKKEQEPDEIPDLPVVEGQAAAPPPAAPPAVVPSPPPVAAADATPLTGSHPRPKPAPDLTPITGSQPRLKPVIDPQKLGGEEVPLSQLSRTLDALQSLSLDKGAEPAARAGATTWIPWALLCAVCLGFGGYQWWQRTRGAGDASPGPTSATRVITAAADDRPNQQLVAAGYMAARDPITIGVTTGGRVKEVRVQNGDKVKRNQVLVQMGDAQALAELRLAWAKARDASRTLQRVRGLHAAQAATMSELEKAQGQLDIANAEVGLIQQQVEFAKVRAPIDGTILEVLARPGEVLAASAAGTGVVKMADLRFLVAEVDVSEGDLRLVRRGQRVDVTTDVYPDRRFQGSVREIAQQADRARGTVQVKVEMEVKDGSLKPGMSVKAAFQGEGSKPRILLPRAAVVDGAVWIVGGDGRVTRRAVTTQVAGPDLLEVAEGLTAGERVVVEGAASLSPGQRVE